MTDAAHVVLWILTMVCFTLTWTAYIRPNWRVRSGNAQLDPTFEMDDFDIVAKTIRRDGLWLTCLDKASGEWQCDKITRGTKPNYYGYIVSVRWCIGLAISFQLFNILIMPFQMPCAFAEEPDKSRIEDSVKQQMTIVCALLCFLTGILQVIAISVYGTNVFTDEHLGFNTASLAFCSFFVIISSILSLVSSLVLALLYNAGRANTFDNENNNLGYNAVNMNGYNMNGMNMNNPNNMPMYNTGQMQYNAGQKENEIIGGDDGYKGYNYNDDYQTNTKMGDTYMVKDNLGDDVFEAGGDNYI